MNAKELVNELLENDVPSDDYWLKRWGGDAKKALKYKGCGNSPQVPSKANFHF